MRLFTTISIETGALCNRKCWFCPNCYNQRPDEFMETPLIHSVLDRLGKLEYNGRIEFYIYNEPMRDDRIYDIIAHARDKVPKSCIMIASNGDYFKIVDQVDRLYDAGLNQLQVNVYSNMQRYKQLHELLLDSQGTPGNIYNKASTGKRLYSIEQKFTRKLTPESTKIGRFELSNRSGHIPSMGGLPEPLQKICVRPFRYMQINWKGEVILCCNDYSGEVICGNIASDPVDVIWFDSEVLKKYRQKLILKQRAGLKLCAPCSFNGGAYPHFIPKYWPELIKK